MKYLKLFNVQLKKFREAKRLSSEDVADFCMVDHTVVDGWESDSESNRCYPSLDNILDLCIKTGTALEYFLDLPDKNDRHQLELPGLAFIEDSDLSATLSELDQHIDKLIPAEDEQELLRKFRKSDEQSRELILQLITT